MTDSQKQVFYKKTPFTVSLPEGLQEGKSVIVVGKISQKTDRVQVNLQCGSESGDDIALHFNPRYDDGPAYVVLNTFQNGNWGPERRGDFFLLKGEPFMLQILVTDQTYKVLVNGKHFMDYKHRIPITRVNTISVNEMVDLDFFTTYNQKPVVVPYRTQITGGLQPGKTIVVYGRTNADYKSIVLKLNENEVLYESNFGNNLAVLRTKNQENKDGVPLKQDELFQVTISWDNMTFTVTVNDQPKLTCSHGIARLQDINLFEVTGDLQLIFVKDPSTKEVQI
ncbi:hypothetical protein ABG768_007671 [Culter alburnus]|uniref:Galectin n=1 Tax=Culter alburnus TaxID=194366 RepID=A0AAW1ZLZ2_CULAL